MTDLSPFEVLSTTISAKHVANRVWASFPITFSWYDAKAKLYHPESPGPNPDDVFVVHDDSGPVGWFGLEDTNIDIADRLDRVMTPIDPGQVIPPQTCILRLIDLCAEHSESLLFIGNTSKIYGFVYCSDLTNNRYLYLLLRELVLELEHAALTVGHINPEISWNLLPPRRKCSAICTYRRKYDRGPDEFRERGEFERHSVRLVDGDVVPVPLAPEPLDGKFDYSTLIECTMFIDKGRFARHYLQRREMDELHAMRVFKDTEPVRNFLVHPNRRRIPDSIASPSAVRDFIRQRQELINKLTLPSW